MESYTNFAEVYDTFMDQTSYEDWADDVLLLMTRFGTARRGEGDTVVDLGCGTGKLTELLAEAGFHMLGIDLSPDMLNIAMGRKLDHRSVPLSVSATASIICFHRRTWAACSGASTVT